MQMFRPAALQRKVSKLVGSTVGIMRLKVSEAKGDSNTDFIVVWKRIRKRDRWTAARAARDIGLEDDSGKAEDVVHRVRQTVRRRFRIAGIDVFEVPESRSKEAAHTAAIWLLSAPFHVLYRTAETTELSKACMGQHGRKGFYAISPKTRRMFAQCPGFGTRFFFTSAERQRLIWHLICTVKHNLRAVLPRLCYHGLAECVPLHAVAFRNEFLWEFLRNPSKLRALDKVAEYYGTELAFYFAWLAHYTTWMAPPAVAGVLLYIIDYYYVGMSPYAIMFAVGMCVWMGVYLACWTRQCNFLKERWGVTDFDELQVLAEPREAFVGHKRTSPVTGRPEIHSSGSKRFMKMYLVSLPLTVFCLYFGFLVMTVAIALQDYCQEIWYCRITPAVHFPSIFYSFTLPVMDIAYRFVAKGLTGWENHKTHSAHQDALVIKLTCFKFINNYLALFYIYFWLGDLERLTQYLQTLMITTQVFSMIIEIGVPYATAKYAVYTATEAERMGVQKSIGTQGDVKGIKGQHSGDPATADKEFDGPITHDRSLRSPASAILQPSQEACHAIYVADVKLLPYDGLLMNEYFTVLRDHGYVIMFGWCWGLAPLCVLVVNVMQLRFDMWKICTSYRRPLYRNSNGIGAWATVLQVYAVLFIVMIFTMLAMYELKISDEDGQTGGAEPFCTSLGIWANHMSTLFSKWHYVRKAFEQLEKVQETGKEFRLLVIVVIEHLVMAGFLVSFFFVPLVPGHVQQSIQRRKYINHQLVRQQLGQTSTRAQRSKSFRRAKRQSMHFDQTATRIDANDIIGFNASAILGEDGTD